MSHINLKHIAHLARLELQEKDLKPFESQVSDILDFVEKLKDIDVEGVEPTSHPLSLQHVFRKDQVLPSMPIEAFLKRAPMSKKTFFEVPKVIEEKS